MESQKTPLLSRNVCERLDLVSMNQSLFDVSMVQIKKLFDGFDSVDTEYHITMKQEATAYSIPP